MRNEQKYYIAIASVITVATIAAAIAVIFIYNQALTHKFFYTPTIPASEVYDVHYISSAMGYAPIVCGSPGWVLYSSNGATYYNTSTGVCTESTPCPGVFTAGYYGC